MKMASEDLAFLRSLGRALLALAVSALVLTTSYTVYLGKDNPEVANSAGRQIINTSQFQTILGTTQLRGETLVLKDLQYDSGQQLALISQKVRFSARSYPLLRYRLEGFQAGLKAQLYWRTAETGGNMFAAPIPGGMNGTTFANLGNQADWRGTVTDIALYISGDLRDQNLIISGISFEPYSWRGVASALFFEWTDFRGWRASSINLLPGTRAGLSSDISSPTLVMAAWGGLALVLLYGFSILQGKSSPISYGAVVLIPWIVLDQFWQGELSTQLQETKRIFAGKSTHEKHLVDSDSYIYSYAKRLKEEVLPESGARIIILDSPGNNYVRLKTQYYLLPHNIYNFKSLPPWRGIWPGDYILVLGDIPELRYLSAEGVLAWEPNNRLKVRLVDAEGIGQLFRVMPADKSITDEPERIRQD